jgi:putative MATE family efflux protein
MLAWPTMLQNMIGGLQGLVDHAMVGHYVGYTGNAAIGVSWQIFLVVIVFIASVFSGMGVLIARFTGRNDREMVNRTVQQSFIVAVGLAVGVMAPLGYVLAPVLLDLINAAPEVQAEALPYLRTMFLFSVGNLLFFMASGAFRSAGDARTPLYLGVAFTLLNIVLNVVFIRGLGPIPAFGTLGAAMGTVIAAGLVAAYVLYLLFRGTEVVAFPRNARWVPDLEIIRELFRFGLPTGLQGVAMNMGGVLLLRFVGSLPNSAEAQAAYAIAYTQLFSFISWTSVGLMSAAATVAGQNLGADRPDRSVQGVHVAAYMGLGVAVAIGGLFLFLPDLLLGIFGVEDRVTVELAAELLKFLTVSGLFITVALAYTGGLQGTGDTKSPLYISIVSQIVVPLGICFAFESFGALESHVIWTAILLGHVTRALLSVLRFRQGKWRDIEVRVGKGASPA